MLLFVMKYPSPAQTEGAAAQRRAADFDLSPRALEFARLYAVHPHLGGTECARQAGYSRRCARGAHVRAAELLRDPRVIRAVIYFGARALNEARAGAMNHLQRLAATEGRFWSRWDRSAFDRLTRRLAGLETHVARLEKIYESGLLRAQPSQDFSLA